MTVPNTRHWRPTPSTTNFKTILSLNHLPILLVQLHHMRMSRSAVDFL